MNCEHLIPEGARGVIEEYWAGMGRQDPLASAFVRADLDPTPLGVEAELSTGALRLKVGLVLLCGSLKFIGVGFVTSDLVAYVDAARENWVRFGLTLRGK